MQPVESLHPTIDSHRPAAEGGCLWLGYGRSVASTRPTSTHSVTKARPARDGYPDKW